MVAPAEASEWAQRLIAEFGGFKAVLDAPADRVRAILCVGPEVGELLAAMNDGMAYILSQRLIDRPIISGSQALSDYLRFSLAGSRVEQVRALYLDVRNFLIQDELVARGTFNQVTIYPRQIVKRALELDAGGIILVHNHPSGDPTPSAQDKAVTRTLSVAIKALDIRLQDHVIVGGHGIVSLREFGLL